MKHLVLDGEMAVAGWGSLQRADVARLLDAARTAGARLWLAVSSEEQVEAALSARELQALHSEMHWLSEPPPAPHDGTPRVHGWRETRLVEAARSLGAVPVCVVSDRAREIEAWAELACHTPAEAAAWLADDSPRPPPLVDLAAQQAMVRPALERRIARVLRHGQYILGPEVGELEGELARRAGVEHCVAVANGTDGLQLALMALGVGAGDEVVVPAFNFVAAAEAAVAVGARPVFADIDARTFNLDAACAAAAFTSRTRAVIASSLFGQCADFDALAAVARDRGIAVIEDAAQSFGATHRGRPSGSLGDIGVTSFFPTKPLGGAGDGGAMFFHDAALAAAARQAATHGQEGRYRHVRVGRNSRLDTLQAAVLLAKLETFDDELARRESVAARYAQELRAIGIEAPFVAPHNRSVWAQYTIRVPKREQVRGRLRELGVPTAVHYPLPLHRQPAFEVAGLSLPVSERAAAEVLSLPFGPYLSKGEQDFVVDALCDALD